MKQGTVYIIHFEQPLHHACHYIGWTNNLSKRLAEHRSGTGARLLAAVNAAGIGWQVVKTIPGGRDLEAKIKRQKHGPRYCPLCRK